MKPYRLLACVDSTPAALAAARLALDFAGQFGGAVRAVSVVESSASLRRLDVGREGEPAERRFERGVHFVLTRIASMGAERDIAVETEMLRGDPLREILRDARSWKPDLVLIGRSGRSGPGSPMMGSLAMHVVEFAEWPVVVVPERA